jgi:hypothetical protein
VPGPRLENAWLLVHLDPLSRRVGPVPDRSLCTAQTIVLFAKYIGSIIAETL